MKKYVITLFEIAALTLLMTATTLAVDAGKWMSGSKADIAGVSASQHQIWNAHREHETIIGVHVMGNYAMDVWSDPHYCCPSVVFERVAGQQWKLIAGSAGDSPISLSDIVRSGVPTAVAHQLCSGWPKGNEPCG